MIFLGHSAVNQFSIYVNVSVPRSLKLGLIFSIWTYIQYWLITRWLSITTCRFHKSTFHYFTMTHCFETRCMCVYKITQNINNPRRYVNISHPLGNRGFPTTWLPPCLYNFRLEINVIKSVSILIRIEK